ncbi:MAG: hypothetical protein AAF559_13325 [Pseudomonadota bacterium]
MARAQDAAEPPEAGKETLTISFKKRGVDGIEVKWLDLDTSLGIPLFEVNVAGQALCAGLGTTTARSLIDSAALTAMGLQSEASQQVLTLDGADGLVQRTDVLSVEVPDQFSFQSTLRATQLPDAACRSGEKLSFVLGRDVLDSVAFAIDPKGRRILFGPSGSINPTSDRFARIEWKDGLIVATLADSAVLLDLALLSRPVVTLEASHFPRVFPDQAIETLNDKQGSKGRKGIDTSKLSMGPLTLDAAVLLGADNDDAADGSVGFTVFSFFPTIFDAGKDQILIRVPDLPAEAETEGAEGD